VGKKRIGTSGLFPDFGFTPPLLWVVASYFGDFSNPSFSSLWANL
jgi:hypothetical protein